MNNSYKIKVSLEMDVWCGTTDPFLDLPIIVVGEALSNLEVEKP